MAAVEVAGLVTVSHKPFSKVGKKKMKKRSANMRVSAVIWDLECTAMSQARWLHCCCCKLTQDKGPQMGGVCMIVLCRCRGQELEKDQAFRGESLKHNYKLSRQDLLAARAVSSLLCSCDRLKLRMKNILYCIFFIQNWAKVSWTQKVRLVFVCGIHKCVDMSLWITAQEH